MDVIVAVVERWPRESDVCRLCAQNSLVVRLCDGGTGPYLLPYSGGGLVHPQSAPPCAAYKVYPLVAIRIAVGGHLQRSAQGYIEE